MNTRPRFPGFLVLLAALAMLAACGSAQTPTPTVDPALRGGTEFVLQAQCDISGRQCSSAQLALLPDVIIAMKLRLKERFGIFQPAVRQQGSDQIVVDVPSSTNAKAAQAALEVVARLLFIDTGSVGLTVGQQVPAGSNYPVVFTGIELNPGSIQAIMDQQTGQPVISFVFLFQYQSRFANYTQQNIGNYLTITLDDGSDNTVLVSVVIQSQITSRAEVPGPDMTLADVQDTAALMRYGALPLLMTIVSQHTISG